MIAVANTLKGDGFDASKDGTGRQNLIPVANSGQVSHCLTASAQNSLDAETETETLIAFDCKGTQVQTDETGTCPTLRSMNHSRSHQNAGGQLAVDFDMRGREGGAIPEGPHDTANLRAASGGSSRSYVAEPWAVRRLTPKECERLMGFPDGWTKIKWRGKPADQCPDGPRYKALGNSWGVNCGELIFDRIRTVEDLEI